MIVKHRNIGFIQLACALALTVFLIVRLKHRGRYSPVEDAETATMLFLCFGTWALWMAASYTLAKAKGYSQDVAGSMFIILIILACCLPIAAFVFPAVVLFGLKDKTRNPLGRF